MYDGITYWANASQVLHLCNQSSRDRHFREMLRIKPPTKISPITIKFLEESIKRQADVTIEAVVIRLMHYLNGLSKDNPATPDINTLIDEIFPIERYGIYVEVATFLPLMKP